MPKFCKEYSNVWAFYSTEGKISAQPHTFIMHTVLCLKKTIAVTIARICNLPALEKVYFFLSPY